MMRKNFILKKRRPLETMLELLSPFVFLFIMWSMAQGSGISSRPAFLPTLSFAQYPIDTLTKFGRMMIDGDAELTINDAWDLSEVMQHKGAAPLLGLDDFLWIRSFLSAKVAESGADSARLYQLQRDFMSNRFGSLLVDGELMIADGCPETLGRSCDKEIGEFVQHMSITYSMWDRARAANAPPPLHHTHSTPALASSLSRPTPHC